MRKNIYNVQTCNNTKYIKDLYISKKKNFYCNLEKNDVY